MRRSFSATLAALLIALVMPMTVVRAADIATTIEITFRPGELQRGTGPQDLIAEFTPLDAQGTFTFEYTYDRVDYFPLSAATLVDRVDGRVWGTHEATIDTPLGHREIRVKFTGDPGYASSVSLHWGQDVVLQHTQVSSLTFVDPIGGGGALPGEPVQGMVTVHRSPTVLFQRETPSGWETVGQDTRTSGEGDPWLARATLPALGDSLVHMRAYTPTTEIYDSDSVEMDVQLHKAASTTSIGNDGPFEIGHPLHVTTNVSGSQHHPPTGTVSIIDTDTSQTLATLGVAATTAVALLEFRVYHLRADYGGDTNHLPSSQNFDVEATADTVHAESVKVQYTTFYPVVDSYRDTTMFSGRRLETASGVIRIYSPSGTKIKTVGIPSGGGAYTYKWTGRNSAGTVLAAGRYRVTQTLTDSLGHSKTWTFYVTLSRKRLVTRTIYVTRKGSSITVRGDAGSGSIAISTSGGYVKLHGVYPNGWVGVGYQFTIPSATVYKSLTLEVYNKGLMTTQPSTIGLQNFLACPYNSAADWNFGCFDRQRIMGSTTGAKVWTRTSGSVSANRYGRTVRGAIGVPYGTFYVYTARLKVVYGVLV